MKPRFVSVERLEAIVIAAVTGRYGYVEPSRVDPAKFRRKAVLRLDMDCQNPFIAELHARYSATHYKRVKPMWVEIWSRCRKCETCRERRAMFWRGRAFTEYQESVRTFFGTLTTTPEYDARMNAELQARLAKDDIDFGRLEIADQFKYRVAYTGLDVTKYIKRLRGDAKARRRPVFRYLLIAEAHDSVKTAGLKRGHPHWHCLFHEVDTRRLLVNPEEFARKPNGELRTDDYGNAYVADDSFLKTEWHHGFSKWLVAGTPQAAVYCTKYLTKEARFRIRASGMYGLRSGQDATVEHDIARGSDATPTTENNEKIDPPLQRSTAKAVA